MYIIRDTQIFAMESKKKMLSNPVKSIFSYIIRPCSYNSVDDSAFQSMCGCIMILKAVVWISKIHSDGLDENVPHRLIFWNACSFYDGTDWEKLEGVMLLEGVCH